MDQTHDRQLRSWIESANQPGTDFPIQNLPLGVFRRSGRAHIGVAIGDVILDLYGFAQYGLLDAPLREACVQPTLNSLMTLGRKYAAELRRILSHHLNAAASQHFPRELLVSRLDAEMLLPVHVGDYTDFYASIHHATNVGRMFRPDSPLLPNYKWLPIAYHGRASSILVSGSPVRRPRGQTKRDNDDAPVFGPCRLLDFELEVGLYIAEGNAPGSPIEMAHAVEQMFGLCLVNDWSARDIQKWEYQPLGPFLAKSFATTVSPWVVTLDALEPFRAPREQRAPEDPQPLSHLDSEEDRTSGAFDIRLEVFLSTARMRAEKVPAVRLTETQFRRMYWTFAQMVAHHTSNGCNLRPGDLLASGTVSGPGPDERGSLLELTSRDNEVKLPTGESRRFLQDGDEVTFGGRCEREGFIGIGFGNCSGIIVA